MQRFAFFIIHGLLFTIVKSHFVNEEIQLESSEKELWSIDHSLYDLRKDRQASEEEKTNSNSNEISLNEFKDTDYDRIQALSGKNQNPTVTVHLSRYLRSIKTNKIEPTKKQNTTTEKEKKETKKQIKKKKPQPKKAKSKKVIKNLVKTYPIQFNTSHETQIKQMLTELKYDGALASFKSLSGTILTVTGMLPKKFIPTLEKLSSSYSITTKTLKMGFADLCATLLKFVIKSWRIMQRGMTKEDEDALLTLRDQLNTEFKNELAKFINLSRPGLVDIYSQLVRETAGEKIEGLLKGRDALENHLLRQSVELTNISSECGKYQGKIEAIKYKQQIRDLAIQNSEAAKSEMKAEIDKLRGQIPEYENKVREHRDTRKQVRKGVWIFKWKVQDVYIDNGERIAKENLRRLLDRIRDLEERLKNWSITDLTKQMKTAARYLKLYEEKKIQLDREYTQLNRSYNETDNKFQDIIQQIDQVYQSTGTVHVKGIMAIDELCHALQTGSEALISACNKIQTHLETIDINPNSLVDSVLDALQLINMADEYNDSTKIKDIKRILALN